MRVLIAIIIFATCTGAVLVFLALTSNQAEEGANIGGGAMGLLGLCLGISLAAAYLGTSRK